MEAGIDSLAAAGVVESIGEAFAMELPATLLFDHPSTDAISEYVAAVSVTMSLCQPCGKTAATSAPVLSREDQSSAVIAPKISPEDVEHQVNLII